VAKKKAAAWRASGLDAEAALMSSQPHDRSQRTNARARAQAIPIEVARRDALDLKAAEGRLLALMFGLDGIMPTHRLSADAIGAAAAVVQGATEGLLPLLVQRFAEGTSLTPGTPTYNRAEFRNVVYALHQLARTLNDGSRAPALLALYCFLSSAGVGPHPDRDFWHKLGAGMTAAERGKREREYHTWESHLRNRITLVRRALDPKSGLSRDRREKIFGADPIIAIELQEDIPRQMRRMRGKAR
jgi:hypothetical protein